MNKTALYYAFSLTWGLFCGLTIKQLRFAMAAAFIGSLLIVHFTGNFE